MGRQLRLIADGLVYHALNRGNNRDRVLHAAADFQAFLDALAKTKERYPFRLFCYCLMSNHFHLVLQPEEEQSRAKGSEQSKGRAQGSGIFKENTPDPVFHLRSRSRYRQFACSKGCPRFAARGVGIR